MVPRIENTGPEPLGPRVLILGLPASGKTTFAQSLARISDRLQIEVDRFYWDENRRPVSREVLKKNLIPLLSLSSFVVEGHFKTIHPLLDGRITNVIWLDPPLVVVFFRCAIRDLSRGGVSALFRAEGTFRFLLKNHSKLRKMQKVAFTRLTQSEKIAGQRFVNF